MANVAPSLKVHRLIWHFLKYNGQIGLDFKSTMAYLVLFKVNWPIWPWVNSMLAYLALHPK